MNNSKARFIKALEARSYPNVSLLLAGMVISTAEVFAVIMGIEVNYVGVFFMGIGLMGTVMNYFGWFKS